MRISNSIKNSRKNGKYFKNLDADGNIDEPISLVKYVFLYAFRIATLDTMRGEKIEVFKNCGHFSTFMRVLTNKDRYLLSHFDKSDESQNGMKGFSLNQMLIDNYKQVDDRGKIKGQLPLEHIFGLCKTFRKITENLAFHLNLKTADSHGHIYATTSDSLNIELNTFYLYVAIFIRDAEAQTMFND